MKLSNWRSQLRKGAAELAVLTALSRKPLYGLGILEAVAEKAGLEISDGTIYPLLNRLQKGGLVSSQWIEGEASHPRKYYELTEDGRSLQREMRREWRAFAAGMDGLLKDMNDR